MEDKRLNKKRISRFAVVGIFNTAFDFGILNALVFVFDLSSIIANIISASSAMIVSYFLNHGFVFQNKEERTVQRFVIFLAITMVSLYGLQNLIIFLVTHYVWTSDGSLGNEFVRLNFAKGIATMASLTWNYVLYSKFVFKRSDSA